MKKILLTILILLFYLILFCEISYSCSGFSDNSKDFFRKDLELCFINFDNNIEKLLYKVSLAKHFNETDSVIFFPVLKTNEIQIKIINSFPDICGNNFERYFDYKCISNLTYILITQMYTFPFLIIHRDIFNISDHIPKQYSINKIDYSNVLNVKLLKSNKNSIHEFLTLNKLKFPENLNNILEAYNDTDHSLIAIWPNKNEIKKIENLNINLGILISFNTPNIFFPFKSTLITNTFTIYGIYIIGHRIFNYDHPKIEHLIMTNYSVPNELSDFFFNRTFIKNLYYSKIIIRTSPMPNSMHYKPDINDFLINSASPKNLVKLVTIHENILFISILLLLIISFVSSSLAAIIAFRKFEPSIIKFAFFGFFNLFSLLGLILATYYFNISNLFTNGKLPIVKFKTDYLTSSFITTLIIYFSIIALIFFTANTMPPQDGGLFLLIFIAVLIVQLILRLNYYNGLYITLFSVIFCIFMIISFNIYQKFKPI